MDQIANLFPLTGVPSAFYYGGLLLFSVFMGGWFLNGRLKRICEDNQTDLEDTVRKLVTRVDDLEKQKIHKDTYEEDMRRTYELIGNMHKEMRENFINLSSRIDTLILAQK